MSKNLVLVESPAKAKTINKYLGKDYIVEATIGHIRNLPKTKLGVDVDDNFVLLEVNEGVQVNVQKHSITHMMPKGTYKARKRGEK